MKSIIELIKKYPLELLLGLSLGVIIIFAYIEHKVTGSFGAPLDDVYIHFQFSRNLTQGNNFSFNPGEPTPGSTSPAWTILLSIFFLIIKNHLLIAKTLSALFYIFSVFVTYLLGKEILASRKTAFLAAVFTLLTGRLGWAALSGMEITLFTFLLTVFVYGYVKLLSKPKLGLVLGIASTVRPEGYIIFVFFLIIELFQWKKLKENRLAILQAIGVYLLIIIPYLAFSWATTGSILPNTFQAQSIVATNLLLRLKSAVLYLLRYGYLCLTDNPVTTIGIPFGLLALVKTKDTRKFFIALLLLGFPLIASITAPNLRHHGRYIIPFIPLYTITGLYGIQKIISIRKIKLSHRNVNIHIGSKTLFIFTSITLIYLLRMLMIWAMTFGWNVKNINDMHVTIGNWVKENTSPSDVIALNDIGAITYISQREIIDTVGLVSPDILEVTKGKSKEEKQDAIWHFLLDKEPDYLIIIPKWYPNIAEKAELERLWCLQLDRYTIVDGEMCIYKFPQKTDR